ncbi:hypothetical protein BH09PSE1_BH09PSE1_29780 [soil metagenome]
MKFALAAALSALALYAPAVASAQAAPVAPAPAVSHAAPAVPRVIRGVTYTAVTAWLSQPGGRPG